MSRKGDDFSEVMGDRRGTGSADRPPDEPQGKPFATLTLTLERMPDGSIQCRTDLGTTERLSHPAAGNATLKFYKHVRAWTGTHLPD